MDLFYGRGLKHVALYIGVFNNKLMFLLYNQTHALFTL